MFQKSIDEENLGIYKQYDEMQREMQRGLQQAFEIPAHLLGGKATDRTDDGMKIIDAVLSGEREPYDERPDREYMLRGLPEAELKRLAVCLGDKISLLKTNHDSSEGYWVQVIVVGVYYDGYAYVLD